MGSNLVSAHRKNSPLSHLSLGSWGLITMSNAGRLVYPLQIGHVKNLSTLKYPSVRKDLLLEQFMGIRAPLKGESHSV